MALEQFEAWLAGRPQETLGPVSHIGMDQFPLLLSSELAPEHAVVSEYLEQQSKISPWGAGKDAQDCPASRKMLQADRDASTRFALALLERSASLGASLSPGTEAHLSDVFGYGVLADTVRLLLPRADVKTLRLPILRWLAAHRTHYYLHRLTEAVLETAATSPLNEDERRALLTIRSHLSDGITHEPQQKVREAIDNLLGGLGWAEVLVPVEVWAAEAADELHGLSAEQQQAWRALLMHCVAATAANPSAKWNKAADTLLRAVGTDEFRNRVVRWFDRVDEGRTTPMLRLPWDVTDDAQRVHEQNGNLLRGLLWLCPGVANAELMRAIRQLAFSAYRKIRGLGPRAVKVGNAAVGALGAIGTVEAVGQLAILKVRVKFGTAQKLIEKALVATADKAGVPRAELEEMAVPTYGLTEVGAGTETLGDFTAHIAVHGRGVGLTWSRDGGKVQASVPKAVTEGFAEELKELKTAAKDIERMIPAQSARIEESFLARRAWTCAQWRERYLEHPLVGTIARRLIWRIGDVAATAPDGALVDVDGRAIATGPAHEVRLWHPLEAPAEEIVAWRRFFEDRQIRQPFKQAHREVYRLTDAERRTGVYSNRFAAHVLKQHQFNNLVAARGWKHKLRLMVDDTLPPAHVILPAWGLRAEFWIQGLGENYGEDTTESGSFLYVATDQVRFYPVDAAMNWAHACGGTYESTGNDVPANQPLTLADIPPLVLSEVLRDVDLFVGVASVGNDPNWSDGGPHQRHRTYWTNYAFGELSATAATRKEILQRLVPKLKIAAQCTFEDRWLVVKGSLRTYKIHLGSGNILMQPTDQYLCIVAKEPAKSPAARVFLPFEGDGMLSVILSKAFLLADDAKITDTTILSQIRD